MSRPALGVDLPFSKALIDRTGGQRKILRRDYLATGAIPIVDQGDDLIAGYTDDDVSRYDRTLPVIVFGDHTRSFKYVDFPFAIGADGARVLEPSAIFDPRYLYYYLLTQKIPSRGYSRHFQFLRRVSIRWIPPSEQCRIVEILDQADRLRRLRVEADAKANRILPALFKKMFGDPVVNPMKWPKCPLSEMATITTGNTPSRKRLEYYGGSIEWVKSDNLNTASHYVTAATESLSYLGARVARTASPGSTLVTCIAGSLSAIGNSAITEREVAFNQQINAATPKPEVDSWFLYGQFLVGKRLVQDASTGGMKGLVSKNRFSRIEFMRPPPDLQKKFGRHCKRLCDQKQGHLEDGLRFDKLFETLLARAFSGTLTESWREAHIHELLYEMEQHAKVLHDW